MDLEKTSLPVSGAPETQISPPFAVIDIGSTSIRMVIAEVHPDGSIRTLEFVHQTVPLGKDTFTVGSISRDNIDNSIKVLKHFRQICNEYHIPPDGHLRCRDHRGTRSGQ
jgi:exopolyphosphatase/guanosine-5'-triphosphate,3'-diphosphate pyrophosphatase